MTTLNVVHMFLVTYAILDETLSVLPSARRYLKYQKHAFATSEFKKQIRNRTSQNLMIFKKQG